LLKWRCRVAASVALQDGGVESHLLVNEAATELGVAAHQQWQKLLLESEYQPNHLAISSGK